MKSYVFEGVVTALTSISHIGDTYGINANLRREKIIQPDGSVEDVPVISGNSIRGILRDRGMLHMLKSIGYGINETGEVLGLSLAAFYFLFSGGSLTKSGAGIDIDEARRWRKTIPLVSIFGGAMGNQIMSGKLKIGKMIPICNETKHLIPDRFVKKETQSIWDFVQEEAYTRRDDEKNENLRRLIDPEVRGMLEMKATQKQLDLGSERDISKDTGQKQQMRYFVETLSAGTLFYWDLILDDVTDVEFEAFCICLAEFGRNPYIGGKSNVGHGKISIHFDKWHAINPRLAPTGKDIDMPIGEKYTKYLRDNADFIRSMLDAIQ